jgi:Uma2 family endonuclease
MHDVQLFSARAPRRTTITATSQSFFARWLARREWDERRWELVHGRVVPRRAAGPTCVGVTRRLSRRLAAAAEGTGTVVLESYQGLELPTGDTLVPEIGVVSPERWSAALPSEGNLLRVVPDLVVEVLAVSTERPACEVRREIYERAGVREYWIVDPFTRTITVSVCHRACFELGWVLSGADVLRSALVPELRAGLSLLF